jgi:cbb3-type cytochrome oxidase subunit 3
MKKIVSVISLLIISIIVKPANAITMKLGGLDSTAKNAGYVKKSVTDLTGNALSIILSSIGILFLGLMIYGGITWMTAQGNIDQVSKAKNLIIASVIGLIIIVMAFAITAFIGDSITPTTLK